MTRVRAGEYLLHPAVPIAIAVLVINDHLLKDAFSSWWTGKLSDVAGMVFFPLILAGLLDVGAHLFGRGLSERGRRRLVIAAVVMTGVVFAAIQVSPPIATVYRYGLGAIQWPVHAVVSFASGGGIPGLHPVAHTADPSDILAMPALLIPLAIGLRRSGEK
ncbi:MAG: hypothetical protein KJO07_11200 [Deltaproteobacteria bacterium]|jgi:hypothetical protein|nr:hypothetical protein [Deltaproteobacteria bacterium]